MAKDAMPAKPTWTPNAWTPLRCRVWNLLQGGTYDEQIRPQDQAMLGKQQATAEAA